VHIEWYELIVAIVGSATFGAIIGKAMDAFLLAKINNEYEKRKWLRQAKLEAFTDLSQEILSLGLKNGLYDDEWRFKALAAKTMLLIEDKSLVEKIDSFINILSEETLKDRDTTDVVSMVERGLVLQGLKSEALSIVESLKTELNKK